MNPSIAQPHDVRTTRPPLSRSCALPCSWCPDFPSRITSPAPPPQPYACPPRTPRPNFLRRSLVVDEAHIHGRQSSQTHRGHAACVPHFSLKLRTGCNHRRHRTSPVLRHRPYLHITSPPSRRRCAVIPLLSAFLHSPPPNLTRGGRLRTTVAGIARGAPSRRDEREAAGPPKYFSLKLHPHRSPFRLVILQPPTQRMPIHGPLSPRRPASLAYQDPRTNARAALLAYAVLRITTFTLRQDLSRTPPRSSHVPDAAYVAPSRRVFTITHRSFALRAISRSPAAISHCQYPPRPTIGAS
ncbi:hypothetical protein C8J57DRAFT_174725 [Mycena rebaudengoi]|nr:hypothetical protein C8J57DRAFT_174725 [Mycena rebaudengoi]